MVKRNPAHAKVGDIFREEVKKYPGCLLFADPACRGKHRVPLFLTDKKSRAVEYCNVDLLAAKNGDVKIIVEIEESDIKPTQVCGKFLTSALSKFYMHGSEAFGMAESVQFLQILDTSKLKAETSKLKQFKALEESIKNILRLKGSKIAAYKLLKTEQLGEIPRIIEEALG